MMIKLSLPFLNSSSFFGISIGKSSSQFYDLFFDFGSGFSEDKENKLLYRDYSYNGRVSLTKSSLL